MVEIRTLLRLQKKLSWKKGNRVILWLEISYWVVWQWWRLILRNCIERMSWWPSLGQLVKIFIGGSGSGQGRDGGWSGGVEDGYWVFCKYPDLCRVFTGKFNLLKMIQLSNVNVSHIWLSTFIVLFSFWNEKWAQNVIKLYPFRSKKKI